jgi:hypothetical protein
MGRYFGITAEGQWRLVAVAANAGFFTTYRQDYTVDVLDGELTMQFSGGRGYAFYSALQIFEVPTPLSA